MTRAALVFVTVLVIALLCRFLSDHIFVELPVAVMCAGSGVAIVWGGFIRLFLTWRQADEHDRGNRRTFEGARNSATTLLLSVLLSASLVAQDADYSGTLVAAGNALTFAFDTSNIVVPPPGWGAECTLVGIGSKYGMSLWYRRLPVPNMTGFVTDLDFLLVGTSMGDGTVISIAVAKADNDALFTAPVVWRLYFARFSSGYRFGFAIDEGEDEVVWEYLTPVVELRGHAYRHRIEYDIKNQRIAWTVDGQLVNSMVMVPRNPQNIAFQIVGSSASSTGRNTIFLLDRVAWQAVN